MMNEAHSTLPSASAAHRLAKYSWPRLSALRSDIYRIPMINVGMAAVTATIEAPFDTFDGKIGRRKLDAKLRRERWEST